MLRWAMPMRVCAARFADALRALCVRACPIGEGRHRLLGTSGTVTTLASVYLKLQSYDRKQIDGLHLPTSAMRDISQELAARAAQWAGEISDNWP